MMNCSQPEPGPGTTRVACVGDSITYGDGVPRRQRNCYPARLQRILGDAYAVRNFGVNGATLLREGDLPYWQTAEFRAATRFEPAIVVIKLGTNDSVRFADCLADTYVKDYLALIDHFAALPGSPRIFICYPAPLFFPGGEVIETEILPRLDEIATSRNVTLIDLFHPLKQDAALFPDAVHPNADGAAKIAKLVHAALIAE